MRNEATAAGSAPARESIWQYFVNKCANNLHVVLAMSPVGDTLRTRCRNFPGKTYFCYTSNIPYVKEHGCLRSQNYHMAYSMGSVTLLGFSKKRPLLEASPISENLVLCIFMKMRTCSCIFSELCTFSCIFSENVHIFLEMHIFSCIFSENGRIFHFERPLPGRVIFWLRRVVMLMTFLDHILFPVWFRI